MWTGELLILVILYSNWPSGSVGHIHDIQATYRCSMPISLDFGTVSSRISRRVKNPQMAFTGLPSKFVVGCRERMGFWRILLGVLARARWFCRDGSAESRR